MSDALSEFLAAQEMGAAHEAGCAAEQEVQS
jgi:hypothetical protein